MRSPAARPPGLVLLALATCLLRCQLFTHFTDCESDRDCARGQVCNPARHFCQTDTAEVCGNNRDDDRDGLSDDQDDFGACAVPDVAPGAGCRDGVLRCTGALLVCRQRTTRAAEDCFDGIDNDCNGVVDDSDACTTRYPATTGDAPLLLGTTEGASDDGPPHRVCLDGFRLDRYEVTVEAFARFLNEQPRDAVRADAFSPQTPGAPAERYVLVTAAGVERPYARLPPDARDRFSIELSPSEGWRAIDRTVAHRPMLDVTWYGADAYCRWAGKRLPTEAEWWRAVHGADGQRSYPWGSAAADCSRANTGAQGTADGGGCAGGALPVDALPMGANPEHAEVLVGNASEWLADWLGDTPDRSQNTYFASTPDGGWCGALPHGPLGPDAGGAAGSGGDAGLLCLHCKFARGAHYASASADPNAREYLDPDRASDVVGFRCAAGGP